MGLKEMIEKSRDELNNIIANNELIASEIIKLSQELDYMIVEYQKKYLLLEV